MNEFELIDRLAGSVGDDCAVIPKGDADILISTDAFAEGIHFKRSWGSWESIGKKCLLAALSDISAMGGTPKYFWVSVSFPKSDVPIVPEALYSGFKEIAAEAKIQLAGGDTTASPTAHVWIDLVVWGEVPHGTALLRSNGEAGTVFVTGKLGAGALAVRQKKIAEPPRRWALAEKLRNSGCVTAMIDVSDGLVADLGHIAKASGLSIQLRADKIPCLSQSSLEEALIGGEDYELAFLVSQNKEAEFLRKFSAEVTQVGQAVVGVPHVQVITAQGKELSLPRGGFNHYE